MPDAFCVRYKRKKIPNNNEDVIKQGRNYGYPGRGDTLFYGESDAQPYINYDCCSNAFGRYQPSFSGYTGNEYIMIMQSTWKYSDKEKWHERCWARADLQGTYRHEAKHIKNARDALEKILKSTIQVNSYGTIDECGDRAQTGRELMLYKWNEWYKAEHEHRNFESPRYFGVRNDYSCSN
jgi:hypothetical protein